MAQLVGLSVADIGAHLPSAAGWEHSTVLAEADQVNPMGAVMLGPEQPSAGRRSEQSAAEETASAYELACADCLTRAV